MNVLFGDFTKKILKLQVIHAAHAGKEFQRKLWEFFGATSITLRWIIAAKVASISIVHRSNPMTRWKLSQLEANVTFGWMISIRMVIEREIQFFDLKKKRLSYNIIFRKWTRHSIADSGTTDDSCKANDSNCRFNTARNCWVCLWRYCIADSSKCRTVWFRWCGND